jgi:REP element-mobilizing transposase RayT
VPRKARLDTPGTLHHVIIRGIERRRIVNNNPDREDFVSRMGDIALDTETSIYAWSLMTNHAHILLRSGPVGLSTYMRRLLTGYAVSYNLRHSRHGHLFQNRFKSIICEEDAYFKELVRYIHLNPLRANLVESLAELERYPWCGHSVLLGKFDNDWQDSDYVLKWFGRSQKEARHTYRHFIRRGADHGRRPDLVGGGLIRSAGGWSVVKAIRRSGAQEISDERILGSSDFVDQVIRESEEKRKYQFPDGSLLEKSKKLIVGECNKEKISLQALKAGSRQRDISKVRLRLAIILVNEYGLSKAETARFLGVSASAIANAIRRDQNNK